MHHFVGHSEEGHALYRDGCTDEVCALDSYVGQVIDLSPVAEELDHVSQYRDMIIARVGAPVQQGGIQQSQPRATAQANTGLPRSLIPSPPIAQAPRGLVPISPIAPGVQAPPTTAPAEPWWAHYGELEGGHYIATPTPGATFEMEAFGSPEDLAAMQAGQETPEDLMEEQGWSYPAAPSQLPYTVAPRGRLTGIIRAAGRFLAGQWAHGNAPPPPHKAMRTRQNQGKAQGQNSGARAASCAARNANPIAQQKRSLQQQGLLPDATNSQNVPFCQAAYSRDPQGYMGAAQAAADAGVPWCPQTYAQDPAGYCAGAYDPGAQQGYGPSGGGGGYAGGSCCYAEGGYAEGEYAEEQAYPDCCFDPNADGEYEGEGECDYGEDDYCDHADEGSYYAGQAPAGLGEGIGGALGGILGAFIGAPELGAPIGAGIGGAIQGAACHHAVPGFGVQVTQTKTFGSATLHGSTGPDGLFDPSPSEMGPIADVVRQGNAILRRSGAGGAPAGTPSRRTRVGQSAEEIFDDTPRFQAAGFWDDLGAFQENVERRFEDAADWTYDQGDSLVHYAVGGGPGAKDFGPYSQATIQSILQGLRNAGYDVEGANPYDVDVKQHGVKLAATVHADGTVTIAIASSYFYVTHDQVWSKVDPLMPAAG